MVKHSVSRHLVNIYGTSLQCNGQYVFFHRRILRLEEFTISSFLLIWQAAPLSPPIFLSLTSRDSWNSLTRYGIHRRNNTSGYVVIGKFILPNSLAIYLPIYLINFIKKLFCEILETHCRYFRLEVYIHMHWFILVLFIFWENSETEVCKMHIFLLRPTK